MLFRFQAFDDALIDIPQVFVTSELLSSSSPTSLTGCTTSLQKPEERDDVNPQYGMHGPGRAGCTDGEVSTEGSQVEGEDGG
jgi:hypothetical protein